MDMTSIAKLQKNQFVILEDIGGLSNIYTAHIRPLIDDNALSFEQNYVYYRPTLVIESDGIWHLSNNFELYHLIKRNNVSLQTLSQEVPIIDISKDVVSFGMPFYELIDIVTRHKRKLSLEVIYKSLNEFLTLELNKKLFHKNTFPITTFCQLIGITEQTYHARISSSVK